MVKSKVKHKNEPTTKVKSQNFTAPPNKGFLYRISNNINFRLPYLVLFFAAIILYSNTIGNDYAIDDGIVITENNFTKKGVAGIKDILTHDAFAGCLGENAKELVEGGRYRPLSIVSFAIEHQFWGEKPAISHAINVILFAFLALLIYQLLLKFEPQTKIGASMLSWPFLASLLFVVHPIHTEVVANIKGRDEIFALIFSISTVLFSIKYFTTNQVQYIVLGVATFFLALLSKENAITFWAIFPLCYYFLSFKNKKALWVAQIALILPIIIFLVLRQSFASGGLGNESAEIMNNPFVNAIGTERLGTIALTWVLYLKILIAPLVLTHDYYFNQIPYENLGAPLVLLSIVIHLFLIYYSVASIKKKGIISFSILYYFITFSVVSNLLFSVGILMNERFMFMPSLGFCIAIGFLINYAIVQQKANKNAIAIGFSIVLVLFSVKTFSRNLEWKNNLTLLAADVESSPNSAKANSTYGGLLYEHVLKITDTFEQNQLLELSYQHLQKALVIYPNYSDALQLYGNVLFRYKKDYGAAIIAYQKSLDFNTLPNAKLLTNLGMAQLNNKEPLKAKNNLIIANSLSPNIYNCVYSLGEVFEQLNQLDSALIWYQKSIKLQPSDGIGYYKIASIFGKKLNNLSEAIIWFQQAVDREPNNLVYLEDLSVAYGINGDIENSISIAEKIIQINPKYSAAYRILSASYLKKGDKGNSDLYLQKANSVL